jgi:hypothetical protein
MSDNEEIIEYKKHGIPAIGCDGCKYYHKCSIPPPCYDVYMNYKLRSHYENL